MCGKDKDTVLAEIEGVELKVCQNCARHGKIRSTPPGFAARFQKQKFVRQEGPEERVVENYAYLLRGAREKRQMSQEDFAKFLNEKESQITKWESSAFAPDLETAKKLEKKLGLTLVFKDEANGKVEKGDMDRPRSDVLTLGDFIKVKKRK